MSDLIEMLKEKRGPGGDLYLTRTHADHLLRWVQIVEKQLEIAQDSISELQKIMKMLEQKPPNQNS